ncbi:unnamed protein product, partial [Mesorhabditis spiculigera]
MANNSRSVYLPAMQAMPGLTNQQIRQLHFIEQLRAAGYTPVSYFQEQRQLQQQQLYEQDLASQVDASDDDCKTAVEGHEVAGRQVGNGSYDASTAGFSVRSQHFDAYYQY